MYEFTPPENMYDFEKVEGSNTYREYINSEAWQKLRQRRLKIDNFLCQEATCEEPAQEVHHIKYPENGDFTKDTINNLVSLCVPHHKGCHYHKQEENDEFEEYGSNSSFAAYNNQFVTKSGKYIPSERKKIIGYLSIPAFTHDHEGDKVLISMTFNSFLLKNLESDLGYKIGITLKNII